MNFHSQQLINNQWLDASNGNTWPLINPATEELIASVPFGDATDARLALSAAHDAFPTWSRSTAYERAAHLQCLAALIRTNADQLAKITITETGKPILQARGEWVVSADLFDWFAEEGKRAYGRIIPSRNPARRLLVLRQPLGVVGLITAWNFPIYNIARASAAALAAGCTVVIRPSEFTPQTAFALAALALEAGFPPGVLNVINGDPASIGQEFLANPICAKIHFTGSPRVGKILMDGASKTITRLSLELGGNAPVLVFPDVDLDSVATTGVAAKFRNAGQVCVSPQRFIVHESIAEQFAQHAAALTSQIKLGLGTDPTTQLGPLINQTQRERVEALIAASISAGAKLLTGGKRPTTPARGYFLEPTVLTNVAPTSPIANEELFGPVLPILTFSTTEQALTLANATRHGLSAYAWTNNIRTAREVAEQLEFGLIGLNDWYPQATEGPFAGWKESGIGAESGSEGLNEYLETKQISLGI